MGLDGGCMDAFSYSHTRQNLAAVMDLVSEGRAPVLITRQKGRAVVMLSVEDYHALEETAHLLAAPANAARLREAVAELGAAPAGGRPDGRDGRDGRDGL
jgi:antitoxin YefM